MQGEGGKAKGGGAGTGKSGGSTTSSDGAPGSGSGSTASVDAQLDEIVVTAKSRSSGSAATLGMGGLSFIAAQFAEWVRATNNDGGLRPSETNGQAPAAKPLNSNADVDRATQNKAADRTGLDTVENPVLDQFMLDISKPLLDLRIRGGDREKFITIGTDSSGNYVVTSILAVGENGASFSPDALRDSAAIAHTHLYDENQQPANGDDTFLRVTNKPSFQIGANSRTLFEIERNNGLPSIRSINGPSSFGPWETFRSSSDQYRIYSNAKYPPKQ